MVAFLLIVLGYQKGPEYNGGVPPDADRYSIPIGDNPVSGYDSGIAIISYDGDFQTPKTVHESQVHLNLNLVCKKQITLYKVGFLSKVHYYLLVMLVLVIEALRQQTQLL